jgi:hypothetical protein
MEKVRSLDALIKEYIKIFIDKENGNKDETVFEEERLKIDEKKERFGLQIFRHDHLL